MPELRPILLVEDDALDLELMLHVLARVGVANDIDVARDGSEALDYLAKAADDGWCPAVTLLDLKLPRVSGLDVLRYSRGRREFCQMPIVVLSSSRLDDDVKTAYRLGANAYVPKPIEFADLVQTASSTVDFWLRHNLPPPDKALSAA